MKKEKHPEAVTFLFGKMWRYAKGHRGMVVLFLVLSLVANLIALLPPLVFGEFLNELQQHGLGEHNFGYLALILLSLIGIDVAFWLFHGPSRIIERATAFRTGTAYREHLLSRILGMNLSWHAERDSGDSIDKVNKATSGITDFSENIFSVVRTVVQIVGTTIILLLFNIPLGVITLLILLVALWIISQFDTIINPQLHALNRFENTISARIYDAISNVVTVKVLHIEHPVWENMRSALWAPFSLFKRNVATVEAKWSVGGTLFTTLTVVPIIIYLWQTLTTGATIAIGTVSTLYLYLSRLIEVYYTFAGEYHRMIINRAKVKNAEEIECAEYERVVREVAPRWQTIHFSEVTFAYNSESERAINACDFSAHAGERIAIIGASGSGKTTFLKVLHGLYPTARARIGYDNGVPIETALASIDLNTTLVPQEPEVFSASIRENITLGLPYSDSQVLAMADTACFSEVIARLPRGLDSIINERGVNLSGGQKQRLALTRALLFAEGKHIILLDESTSSVDPETETTIYHNIFSRFPETLIIASIHKLHLSKHFDRIIIFDAGHITDNGSFDELLSRNSAFRAEWEAYVAQQEHA